MQQVGQWWLPAGDKYFAPILTRTPDGFELDHLAEALRFVDKFDYAVDVGAHVGTWTLKMAKHFKQVMAFEPAKDTFECLTRNVKEHEGVNITLCPSALGSYSGLCDVEDDPARIGNTGARVVRNDKDLPGLAIMSTLDRFCLNTLDFLKIDVEGQELNVLIGALGTIMRCKPVILMECKQFAPPRFGGPEVAKAFLTRRGFREVGGIRNDRIFKHG